MAAVQQRNGRYRVLFRFHGKQHTFTLGRVSETEAQAKADQVEYLLMHSNRGCSSCHPAGTSWRSSSTMASSPLPITGSW